LDSIRSFLPGRQLLLDLGEAPPPDFASFVVGHNTQVLDRLQNLSVSVKRLRERSPQGHVLAPDASALWTVIWGEDGCGKSHLLQAACHAFQQAGLTVRYLTPHSPLALFAPHENVGLFAIDDADLLDPPRQIALFSLFNVLRDAPFSVVLCSLSQQPTEILSLRADLRTRLSWGLVLRVQGLTDEQRLVALHTTVKTRGWKIPEDVLVWLLQHCRNDMGSLMDALALLEDTAVATHKPVTLTRARRWLGNALLIESDDH
jgi:DnaA-homolog protein